MLWSHDFIKDFNSPELLIRPVVKTGYGCSPIAYRDTIICSVGGPGQSVMAFRQSDGAVVWKSGDFLTSEAPPILITMGGREQLVVFGGGTVNGMDPANGKILWSHVHDPGNDLNCGTPLFGPDNILFVSSAYRAGSRAIQLTQEGAHTHADELWFTNRVRFMFLNAIRVGDYVYGTTGDFGPAFLTALNIKTGAAGVAASRLRPRQPALRRRQGDHHGRGRRPGAGQAGARRRDHPLRGEEGVRHGVVDGADAGRQDAVRARPRKDRRAQPGSPVMRLDICGGADRRDHRRQRAGAGFLGHLEAR